MSGLALFPGRRTPLVLQDTAAECGLACLAMVAGHHGLALDLRAARARMGATPRGARLEHLIAMAARIGLRGRALRAEPGELDRLALPAVLHWGMDHFVVLERLSAGGASILDPAQGERRVAADELDREFTGVALELEPATDFAAGDERTSFPLARLFEGVPSLRATLIRVFAVSLVIQAFALAMPLLLQLVVDDVLVSADGDLMTAVVVGGALLLATQTLISVVRALMVQAFAARLGRSLHIGLFEHLSRVALEFFAQRHSGDIASRFASLDAIQRTLTTSFVEAVIDGLLGVLALAMMLAYSPALTAVVVVAVVLYLALRALWFQPMRRALEAQLHHGARRQSHLLETLRVMPTLRVYGAEDGRVTHQDQLNCEAINAGLRGANLGLAASTANALLFGAENLAVLWLGAHAVIDGAMSLGMLMAFMSFKSTFTSRAASLVDRGIEYRMLDLHAARIGVVALEPALPRADAGHWIAPGAARVEFEGLGHRHPHGEWLFRGVGLTLEPGRCLVVVGPSGVGKTTLARLVLGLIAPSEGFVRVDGAVVRPACRDCPRHGIAAVLQDDALVAGTLAENIAFAERAPDLARVERAARLAEIHDDIMAMPMRYDTLLGELGGSLSGGQRQRVMLARALYFEPRLLVLDEATSHLDVARERAVVAKLRSLPMTRIVIAHRAETIQLADQVLDLGAVGRATPKGFEMQA